MKYYKKILSHYNSLEFNEKALYNFSIVILVFLCIFIPIRIAQGETNLVIINSLTFALTLVVNVLIISGNQKIGINLFVIMTASMLTAAIYFKGVIQISWLYPATAVIFFAKKPKFALIINTSLVLIIGLIIIAETSKSEWIQHILSVQVTIFVVYFFCLKVNEQLELLESNSLTDKLSGLDNRRAFDTALKNITSLKTESKNNHFLAIIDIDNFKVINDTYGHDTGDAIIKDLSSIIKTKSRGNEKAYRIGGEEFALMITADSIKKAINCCERIRKIAEASTYLHKQSETKTIEINYTFSAGIARFNSDINSVYKKADKALYQAKSNGKNRTEILDP